MTTERRISFTAGPAGWLEARWQSGGQEFTAFARLAPGKSGNWRITEVRMLDPTAETLRSFPLIKLEDAVNASDLIAVYFAQHFDKAAPDDLPGYFRRARSGKGARLPLERKFKLSRPPGRRLPDDFYEQVARSYTEAVAYGLNPRKTLATDSGIPADTVARWISEARKRGHLPPGEPGKITALAQTLRAARDVVSVSDEIEPVLTRGQHTDERDDG